MFDRGRGVWIRGLCRRVVVAIRADVRIGGFPAPAAGRGFESDHQRGGAEGGVEDKIRGASGVIWRRSKLEYWDEDRGIIS